MLSEIISKICGKDLKFNLLASSKDLKILFTQDFVKRTVKKTLFEHNMIVGRCETKSEFLIFYLWFLVIFYVRDVLKNIIR